VKDHDFPDPAVPKAVPYGRGPGGPLDQSRWRGVGGPGAGGGEARAEAPVPRSTAAAAPRLPLRWQAL